MFTRKTRLALSFLRRRASLNNNSDVLSRSSSINEAACAAADAAPFVGADAVLETDVVFWLNKLHAEREAFVEDCVEIKNLRRVPRHRRDACSMAWRYWFLAAQPSQEGRVIAEK